MTKHVAIEEVRGKRETKMFLVLNGLHAQGEGLVSGVNNHT